MMITMKRKIIPIECGCRLYPVRDGRERGYAFQPCALHGAAPALLAACELAQDYVDAEYNNGTPEDQRPVRGDYSALDELNDALHSAVAKARGKE
jgi:hypothetical protein